MKTVSSLDRYPVLKKLLNLYIQVSQFLWFGRLNVKVSYWSQPAICHS